MDYKPAGVRHNFNRNPLGFLCLYQMIQMRLHLLFEPEIHQEIQRHAQEEKDQGASFSMRFTQQTIKPKHVCHGDHNETGQDPKQTEQEQRDHPVGLY